VGPTAAGKSVVAGGLAGRWPGVEVVSVDSMQVYRGMDVGTAKPGAAERAGLRHHLVDLVDPGQEFSVSRFQAAAVACLEDLAARGVRPLLVGGTGLYLRAVIDDLDLPGQWPEIRSALEAEADAVGPEELHQRLAGLDPVAAGRMLPSNRRRVVRALEVCVGSGRPFSSFGPGLLEYPARPVRIFGLEVPRVELDERIGRRFDRQIEAGLLEEVRALSRRPGGLSRTARQALGYRELLAYLDGAYADPASARDDAVRRIRAFARRQEAWFRRDPRIEWVPAAGPDGPGNAVATIVQRLGDWWT